MKLEEKDKAEVEKATGTILNNTSPIIGNVRQGESCSTHQMIKKRLNKKRIGKKLKLKHKIANKNK